MGRRHKGVRRSALALAALVVALSAGLGRPVRGNASAQVTLTVWDWGAPAGNTMPALNAQFMKAHPTIAIKRIQQPFNSYFTLLRSAVTAHKGPDVVEIYATPYVWDYYRGFAPLGTYVTASDRQTHSFWSGVSTGSSASGTPYAFPWDAQSELFFYNKALFRKAGLDPNKPPLTWNSLLADSAKLKAKRIVPIVAGFKDGYYAEWFGDLFAAQFMTPSDVDKFTANPQWTTAAMVKALTYMTTLYKQGYMTPNAEGINLFPDTVNNFGAGKGAMYVGLGSGQLQTFQKSLGTANVGVFPAPALPGSRYKPGQWYDYGPNLAWSITRWSAHPAEAYQYIAFLGSASSMNTAYTLNGTLPNNRQAAPHAKTEAEAQILNWRNTKTAFPGPLFFIRANPEATYDKVIPQIITGQLSVKDAMQQVQDTQSQTPPVPQG